jgi:hypothetical protein
MRYTLGLRSGGVAEWSIAPVLKTGNGQPFVSSNLTASARMIGAIIRNSSNPISASGVQSTVSPIFLPNALPAADVETLATRSRKPSYE